MFKKLKYRVEKELPAKLKAKAARCLSYNEFFISVRDGLIKIPPKEELGSPPDVSFRLHKIVYLGYEREKVFWKNMFNKLS